MEDERRTTSLLDEYKRELDELRREKAELIKWLELTRKESLIV